MKKAISRLIIVLLMLMSASILFADNSDYATLRKFLSARMYGEAYNELLRQELSGNAMDPKLKNLKKDLLDRTKAKLEKQAKVSPDDAAVFTILADIAFQQGDYDRASQYASTAIANNGSAISNYIFAKILFRKGNISQAFDQMSKVLEAMPDSPIIFNDFQFLYTCQQYGVNTAKKLTKDSSFLVRTTPIAYDGEDLDAPESPFENDPTETAGAPDFSDYNMASSKDSEPEYDFTEENETDVDEDLAELSKLTPSSKAKAKVEERPEPEKKQPEKKEEKKKEPPLPDEMGSDEDLFGEDADEVLASVLGEETTKTDTKSKKVEASESEEDPEVAKIAEAEKLLESARTKFKDEYLEDALLNIQEINKIYPDLPGKQEVEDKILYEKDLLKRYNEMLELYNEDQEFDKALKVFKEAYNYKPKKFKEAPYHIGRCYLLKEDPDKEQALKNFNIVLPDPDLDSETKRDILWTKIEIFIENEEYEQANEIYNEFLEKEPDFAKAQKDNNFIYYKLWWELSKTWILIGFSLFLGIIAFVFILQFLPDIAMWGGDPLVKAQKAFDAGNYEKAVKFGEKGLIKKQPIQRDRQIREVLIQAYYALENYEKVQMHAKAVLKGFPENAIAWGHLAKASVAVKDTSHEAIKMYEDMYRNDPSRRDLLPMLAHHYAAAKDTSQAAMEILTDYHNDAPNDQDTIIALAEGYIKNRTMTDEIVPVLSEAIRIKDKIEYRELLARTFSKCGMYNEAARECVEVLNRSINNIGIHVVYTSSMKKLKKISQAIEQYNVFINQNPGNSQLIEIMNGLKKEAVDTSTLVDDVPKISDELGMPGMGGDEFDEVANFVEPPPEGFEEEQRPSTPIPDFLQEEAENNASESKELPSLPDDIQTLDPFADDDSLLEGFDTEELPEELGGTARVPTSSASSLDSLISDFNTSNKIDEGSVSPYSSMDVETASIKSNIPDAAPKTGVLELGKKLERAKDLSIMRRWDEVIDLLSPEFATERNREAGLLLVDAWLGSKKPELALEIIQTLDIDPEMMTDKIKDAMYRTAEGLELAKKYKDALHMYDTICNADINYKDAFDRSDRLYSKIKNLG